MIIRPFACVCPLIAPSIFTVLAPSGACAQQAMPATALQRSPDLSPAEQSLGSDLRLSFRAALLAEEPATGSTPADAPAAPRKEGAPEAEELSKKLSNPVANLISVPFQFNYDNGLGSKDAGRLLLNIQPVIPFSISEDLNLISRTILPIEYEESPETGIKDTFGLGDTTQSLFFSPKNGDVIWGVGPAFLLPTATSHLFGSGKWGVGPTAVVLRQNDGWTYGMLANHIWSFAGEGNRPSVNSTFLQPFLSYTFPTATSVTLNTESTYNWTSHDWTVPINLVVGQIVKLGDLPAQVFLGGRYYAEAPSGGPEWGIRFGITLLFPK